MPVGPGSAQSAAGSRLRNPCQVRLLSQQSDGTVTTNSEQIAHAARGMNQGDALQEVVERGARKQWVKDASWIMDVMAATVPAAPMYWAALTGEPLGTEAVQATRRLEIEYFGKMGVYQKVPIQQARDGGQPVLGVR